MVFNCQFQPTFWITLLNVYTCKATLTDLNTTTLTQVRGDHFPDRTNDQVEFLWVYDQDVDFIPSNIDAFFPNIRGILWAKTNLSVITLDDLRQFPKLTFFNCYTNKLRSIPGDLFTFARSATYINLADNLIEHVGEGLLDGMNNLEKVGFERNVCIDEGAFTRDDVPLLIEILLAQCSSGTSTSPTTPIIPTTTFLPPSECPEACTERINQLEDRLAEVERLLRETTARS